MYGLSSLKCLVLLHRNYIFTSSLFGLHRGASDCVCTEVGETCDACRATYVGTDGEHVGYSNWRQDPITIEPNTAYWGCAVLSELGWRDASCQIALSYVCRREVRYTSNSV